MFRYKNIIDFIINDEDEIITVLYKDDTVKFKMEIDYSDDELDEDDLDEEYVLLKLIEMILDNIEMHDVNRVDYSCGIPKHKYYHVGENSLVGINIENGFYVGTYSLGDIKGIKLKSTNYKNSSCMIMDFSHLEIRSRLMSAFYDMDDYLEGYYDEIEYDDNPLVNAGATGQELVNNLFDATNKAYESKQDNKLVFDYSKGYVDYENRDTFILFPVGLSREDVYKYKYTGNKDIEDIEITDITTNGIYSVVTFNYYTYAGIKLKTLKQCSCNDLALKDILITELFKLDLE